MPLWTSGHFQSRNRTVMTECLFVGQNVFNYHDICMSSLANLSNNLDLHQSSSQPNPLLQK